jgi:hypothetical protein
LEYGITSVGLYVPFLRGRLFAAERMDYDCEEVDRRDMIATYDIRGKAG